MLTRIQFINILKHTALSQTLVNSHTLLDPCLREDPWNCEN